jgi:uncharacterized protein (DUF1697 family)
VPAQVAFLRAINVGGRRVTMDRLRGLFEELGFSDVSTYIASGNVRFATRSTGLRLETRIEAALHRQLGYIVETFVRTTPELVEILDRVPFAAADIDAAHALLIGFLKAEPSKAVSRQVAELGGASARFQIVGRELHWLQVVRDPDPRIQKAVEKALGVPMTGRNVKTVRKLAAS